MEYSLLNYCFMALKFDDRQFYGKSFEIIFDNDVAFGDQLVAIVEVAQADLRSRGCVMSRVDDIPHDDIIG